MDTEFKSDLREVEARLARGHRELETSLEAEIKRNGTKLEDMDDRYARGEEALRRAEERIGEVQEEVRLLLQLSYDFFNPGGVEKLRPNTHKRVVLRGSRPISDAMGEVLMYSGQFSVRPVVRSPPGCFGLDRSPATPLTSSCCSKCC